MRENEGHGLAEGASSVATAQGWDGDAGKHSTGGFGAGQASHGSDALS